MFFIVVSLLFIIFCNPVYAKNPIETKDFTADPAAYIGDDGKLYVICSHDKPNATNYNGLLDYILLSTDDMVSWKNHGVVFSSQKDTRWARLAYAPDMANINGKYYLYFPDGASSIGVAVSDSPTGPWKDPLGKSLINKNTPGAQGVEWVFDPGVFIDDDGQGYIYFGGGGPGNARVIKLGSDYTSVVGTAQKIDAPKYFEAPYMHKKDNTYYFSYSSDFSSGAATIEYMTSDNPMTGFKHRGTILGNPWKNMGNNNHHSIIEYHDQWYIFYHNRAISNGVYQRSVCVDKLYYNEDGSIKKVVDTEAGVSANPGNSSETSNIQAPIQNSQTNTNNITTPVQNPESNNSNNGFAGWYNDFSQNIPYLDNNWNQFNQ
jgi:beta-xylosidase